MTRSAMPTRCECGCGLQPRQARSKYLPGHNNRGGSNLSREAKLRGARRAGAQRHASDVLAGPIQALLRERGVTAGDLAVAFGVRIRVARRLLFEREKYTRDTAERILRWLAGQGYAPSLAQRRRADAALALEYIEKRMRGEESLNVADLGKAAFIRVTNLSPASVSTALRRMRRSEAYRLEIEARLRRMML